MGAEVPPTATLKKAPSVPDDASCQYGRSKAIAKPAAKSSLKKALSSEVKWLTNNTQILSTKRARPSYKDKITPADEAAADWEEKYDPQFECESDVSSDVSSNESF
jgi:hypothetical protein